MLPSPWYGWRNKKNVSSPPSFFWLSWWLRTLLEPLFLAILYIVKIIPSSLHNKSVKKSTGKTLLTNSLRRSWEDEVVGRLRDACERLRGVGFTQEGMISIAQKITRNNCARDVRGNDDNNKNGWWCYFFHFSHPIKEMWILDRFWTSDRRAPSRQKATFPWSTIFPEYGWNRQQDRKQQQMRRCQEAKRLHPRAIFRVNVQSR